MTTSAEFSGTLPGPDFTTGDLANIQTIDVSTEFGLTDAKLSWVLYSEAGIWPTWQSLIVEGGLTDYASGYDGYCLVMALTWDYLTTAGDMLGLAVDLPNSTTGDQTGLGWILNDDDSTYTGFSYFYDGTA